ncbi:MAG: sulfurtransferase [Actinomycetota bacterium]
MDRLPGNLVSTDWLMEHLGRKGLAIADVRWFPDRPARSDYEEGHIPGAVFVDVDADLAAPAWSGPGRHPLPSEDDFSGAMGRLGIGDDDAVVAYDDAGGSNAARLWWMLTVTGHEAAVLDGGLDVWTGPLQTGVVQLAPSRFSSRAWPRELIADAAEVERSLERGGVVLDARAAERYRAEVELIDKVAGHIPGAKSAPWDANLGDDERFLEPDDLRSRYEALGVNEVDDTIAYCGSGVTTCHDLLAIELSGLGRKRLYEGSWSDWSSDPSRPVATGDEPA